MVKTHPAATTNKDLLTMAKIRKKYSLGSGDGYVLSILF
jgi:hypothetical protein